MRKLKPKIKFCTYNAFDLKEKEQERQPKKVYTTDELLMKRNEELELFLELKKSPNLILAEKSIEEGNYLNSKVTWLLQRYSGSSSRTRGFPRIPSEKINERISSEYVLKLLNSENGLFNFEYTPLEKDILYISEDYDFISISGYERPPLGNTMCFKYENNSWLEGRYSSSYEFDILADGEVIE
jgi:hypothetical protein